MKLLQKILITEAGFATGCGLGYWVDPDFTHAVLTFMLVSFGYLYGILMHKIIGL